MISDGRAKTAERRAAGFPRGFRLVWFTAFLLTFFFFGFPFPVPLPVAAIVATLSAALISGGPSIHH